MLTQRTNDDEMIDIITAGSLAIAAWTRAWAHGTLREWPAWGEPPSVYDNLGGLAELAGQLVEYGSEEAHEERPQVE